MVLDGREWSHPWEGTGCKRKEQEDYRGQVTGLVRPQQQGRELTLCYGGRRPSSDDPVNSFRSRKICKFQQNSCKKQTIVNVHSKNVHALIVFSVF